MNCYYINIVLLFVTPISFFEVPNAAIESFLYEIECSNVKACQYNLKKLEKSDEDDFFSAENRGGKFPSFIPIFSYYH